MQRHLKKRIALAMAFILGGATIFAATAEAQRRGGSRGGRSGRSGGGSFRGGSRGGSSARRSGGGTRFGRSGGSSGIRRSGSSGFRRSGGSSGIGRSGGSARRSSGSVRRSGGSGIIGRSGGIRRGSSSGGGTFRRDGGTSGIRGGSSARRSGNPGIRGGSSGIRGGGSARRGSNSGIRGGGTARRGSSSRSGISGLIRRGASGRSRGSGYWNFSPGNRGVRGRGGIRGGSLIGRRSPFRSRWQVWGNRGIGYRRGLRSSWGFWLSNGYNGWGLGINVGRGYFGYNYSVPLVDYYNPYCVSPAYFPVVEQNIYYDYSQPITGQSSPTDPGVEAMAQADDAFRNGDYRTALDAVNRAAKQMPQNPDVHQFRSLVLLAMGQYRESAAAAHAALVVGRGWNWETLRSFYASRETYTAHLRALEKYRSADKQNATGRFLLGYHYMMLGHGDAAGNELAAVVALEPADQLAAQLLSAISQETGKRYVYEPPGKSAPVESAPEVKQPPAPSPPSKAGPKLIRAAKPAALAGNWKASRDDGTTISLRLLAGGTFQWTATKAGKSTSLEGKYTLKDGRLKLVSAKGSKTLEGTVTPSGDSRFLLKLKWQDPNDPGLNFQRQ